ncbi:RNA-guided pseudouridylation complex pseudouridine synthase subunit Cbf5 [Candidatus Micrarchaeota archaeon]|nr:RNA-guided pseudouridylation complex pseudouridine synthase subunit Cbf5 [Candidatus Micrarchaeota archaeon]
MKELLSNSVIIINKPCGPISHEVTTLVKKILGVNRSGHAGTLDPQVSGVLPVALGRATKLLQYLASRDKTYVCLIKFKNILSKEEIEKVFEKFTGEITQTPPRISAVKKVPRKRRIYHIKIIEVNGRFALFEARVDAGTYIRTLCEDIGKMVGGARMEELRRIAVGKITEKEAFTLQDLTDAVWLWKEKNDESELRKMLKPPEEFIKLKKIFIKENAIPNLLSGAQLMRH